MILFNSYQLFERKCTYLWQKMLFNLERHFKKTQEHKNVLIEQTNTLKYSYTASQFFCFENEKMLRKLSGFRFPFQTENHRSCYQSMASLWMRYFIKVWHHSEWNIFSAMPQELAFWALLLNKGKHIVFFGFWFTTSRHKWSKKGRERKVGTNSHMRPSTNLREGGCAETRCYANWSLGHAHETSARRV